MNTLNSSVAISCTPHLCSINKKSPALALMLVNAVLHTTTTTVYDEVEGYIYLREGGDIYWRQSDMEAKNSVV